MIFYFGFHPELIWAFMNDKWHFYDTKNLKIETYFFIQYKSQRRYYEIQAHISIEGCGGVNIYSFVINLTAHFMTTPIFIASYFTSKSNMQIRNQFQNITNLLTVI